MNPVYFILGTPGSGRRAIVRDLIENGLAAEETAVVLLSGSEAADPQDARLAALANAEVRRWEWEGPAFPPMELPAEAAVFFLADPLASPIDQLEALKPWLEAQGRELARIFCVVDCRLAEKNPVLRQWFDALIHFADVVFLTRREGLANKWLSDFIKHFKDQRFPCHFVQVKAKGDLATPLVWLDPTVRRVSQYFDEGETYAIEGLETDDEEDDEEDTGLLPPEPYFIRQTSGRRDKELPDVREFLPKK
ncbi:conserved hypothetical protein [uncultured Defluviicoccus sp.]|uniref:CobW/HypB/UreG nucleotide-binding domain-containing protein n=1 Tax=metagenome TaxID=256318 RepID=A0A380TIS1_9ZZZZ|nr:conserved hypothetical protein [uncultured Defluviicoccus sp.]